LLDDAILLPLGIALALRIIPAEVMADARGRAQAELAGATPGSRAAAVVIVAIWLAAIGLASVVAWRAFG
jgi:hypothetical protein